jgi:polysaccharide export outer membrane protein
MNANAIRYLVLAASCFILLPVESLGYQAPASLSTSVPVAVAAKTTPSPVVQSDASEYVLGAGDEIGIHVADMDEISDKPMRIDPNGFLDLPLAGRVQASGLTIEQFKTALAGKLKKYINSPQITINLTENQSRPVSIIGAVNNPGVHQLMGPKRLIEVISLAGGLRNDAGPKVILTRQAKWGPLPLAGAKSDPASGSSTASLSLDSLMDAKNPSDDILVQPGDTISIPKADVVYVVGSVKKAGGFQLSSHETISLLQALSLAEGYDQNAAPQSAKILRPSAEDAGNPKEIPVDIKKIFAGKASDVKLYANDVLFVPSSAAKSGMRRAAEAMLQVATGVAIYGR